MLGFTEEEMRSKHCVEFSPPEDAKKDWALFEQLRAGSIEHYQLEKRFLRRDGSLIRGRLSICLVGSGTSQRVFAMVEDLSEKTAGQDEMPEFKADRESLGGRFIQAQEEERTRIGQELRDSVESLVVLSIDLDRFRQNPLESVAESRQKIGEARQQVKDIARGIHALSHFLNPLRLEYLGLAAAAASFCKEFSARERVEIDFHSEGIPNELPKEISVCLYRVLQEVLQATKHRGSRRFEVLLSVEANDIHLTVRDWGIGFDLDVATKGHGLGLISMKERLKLVDGELSIESQPQHGTTIHARVPFKEQASSD
jgi:PAS domain S-box-containing protein